MKNYAKVMIKKRGLSSLQESINIGKQVKGRKLADEGHAKKPRKIIKTFIKKKK
ncbi:MAG: hypothetical protein U9N58_09915 [Thermodesulfobacteriota bacterium]|nr:hypothetical protein [Thermodesulfobacteriota bacterium]